MTHEGDLCGRVSIASTLGRHRAECVMDSLEAPPKRTAT